MYTNTIITENHGDAIGHIGWKYYNTIKKKAMEQEFSWSGLFLSLSIAFFIVISSAMILKFMYQSLEGSNIGAMGKNMESVQIYMLDEKSENNINIEYFDRSELELNKKMNIV